MLDSLLFHLTEFGGRWASEHVSIFQFVGLFRGKRAISFIENLSHEGKLSIVHHTLFKNLEVYYFILSFQFWNKYIIPAWINSKLSSGQQNSIADVMERLRNVPVVPPMESLRQIGVTLVIAKHNSTTIGTLNFNENILIFFFSLREIPPKILIFAGTGQRLGCVIYLPARTWGQIQQIRRLQGLSHHEGSIFFIYTIILIINTNLHSISARKCLGMLKVSVQTRRLSTSAKRSGKGHQ